MIRTIETSPGIYAQGELVSECGGRAKVKDGDTVYTGKLVPSLRDDKPASILPFE